MIGTRLAHYEITSHLGRGGMGEVYRARDTKLKRDVAIKVLPAEFSRDPERVARAQREAEVLASLNHPNIAQIYGQEDAGGSRCLVLEFVDGETLQERSRRGSIPTQEALEIALQIGEALEAAHERGIVHRDLKPGNVKITPDGNVKVLDFGLAKVLEASGVEDLSQSPTMLASGTVGGTILGTAAYMAPEQAKGKTADARSDIWAFGVVLYEMLTGQPAFSGETMVEILSNVLKTDPDWTALPGTTPATVRTLLRRCLQKDRNRRVHAIADARIEIEEALKEPVARKSGEAPAPMPVVAKRRPLWKLIIPALAAVVLASVITGIAVWNFRSPPAPAITRFALSLGENQQFTFTIGSRQLVSLSPDGTRMIYVTSLGPYLRSMSDFEATPIRNLDANIMSPAFSPDGRSIAFYSISEGMLKKMTLGVGAPVALGRIDLPFGMKWDNDGILFGQGNKGILRVSPDGGKPEQLVSVKGDEFAYGPQILPDGQHILFTLATGTSPDLWDRAQIVVQSLKSGERKPLVEGGSDARYLPTGHLVYALGGILFAAPFDPQRLQIGPAVPILEGVRRATAGTAAAHFSFSNNGSLIYIPGAVAMSAGQQELALLDRDGTVATMKLPAAPYESPRISPTGKQLVYGINNGKEADISIYDLSGTRSPLRLTYGGRNRFPIWSADGQRIAFQSDREGDLGIFWQRADGTGTAERLTKPDKGISHVPESWSPKEDRFSFSETNGTTASLWIYSVKDRKAVPFGDLRSSNPFNSVFSPDGRWIAYTLRGPIAAAIFVQPFPATGARIQISKNDIGHHPLWSPDGRELFYFPGANPLLAVSVNTQPSFSIGNPVPVPGGFASNTTPELPRNHDVTADGKLIVVVPSGQRPSGSPVTLPEVRVVLNWFEELKARVPSPQ